MARREYTTTGEPLPTNWFSRSPRVHWMIVAFIVLGISILPALSVFVQLVLGYDLHLFFAVPLGILALITFACGAFRPWVLSKYGHLMMPLPPGMGDPSRAVMWLGLCQFLGAIGIAIHSSVLTMFGALIGPIIMAVLLRRSSRHAA